MYVPLEMRIVMVREKGEKPIPLKDRPVLNSSAAVAEFVRNDMDRFDREAVVLLLLNAKNRLLGTNVVSLGTQGACIVGIPEIFKAALLSNCTKFIVVHNHLSGAPRSA